MYYLVHPPVITMTKRLLTYFEENKDRKVKFEILYERTSPLQSFGLPFG